MYLFRVWSIAVGHGFGNIEPLYCTVSTSDFEAAYVSSREGYPGMAACQGCHLEKAWCIVLFMHGSGQADVASRFGDMVCIVAGDA